MRFFIPLAKGSKHLVEINKTQTKPDEVVLMFSGRLDFTVRRELQSALQNTQTEGTKYVLLDLTAVSFIDCAALGILVRTKQELADAHITLSLISAPGRVFDVLQTMNIDKMMTITSATQAV